MFISTNLTYSIASTSSVNCTFVLSANVIVSGVKYPITPTFTPFTLNVVDLFSALALWSVGSDEASKFETSTGKWASLRNGTRPSMPISNSWLPRDYIHMCEIYNYTIVRIGNLYIFVSIERYTLTIASGFSRFRNSVTILSRYKVNHGVPV